MHLLVALVAFAFDGGVIRALIAELADVGLFVRSGRTARRGLKRSARYGTM